MYNRLTHSQAKTMDSGLQALEDHFKKLNPGKEVVIIYTQKVYRILIDGKLKETLSFSSVNNLL